MFKRYYKQMVIAIFLGFTLGCASTEEGASGVESEAASRRTDCISQGSIRDYKVLDDANLIVTEGASRKYHVALNRKVFGLRSTHAIGFESATGRVCGGFDSLIVDDNFGPEKVRITSIRRLTPDQEQELLVSYGLREPEFEQPRQPESVEGAEVEELD